MILGYKKISLLLILLINSINITLCFNNILLSLCVNNKNKYITATYISKIAGKKYDNFKEYFYSDENNMKILKAYYDYYDKHKTAQNIELNIYNNDYNNDYNIDYKIEYKYDVNFNKEFLNKLYNDEYVKDIHLSKNDNTALVIFHNASRHEYIYDRELF
jgi:transaldolase